MKRSITWVTTPMLLLALVVCPANINAQDEKKKEDDKPTLQELIGEVVEHLENDETEEALEVLRKARKHYPKSIQANMASIQVLVQIGMKKADEDRKSGNKYFYESAKVARHVLKFKKIPERAKGLLGASIYYEAGSLAVDGKKDKVLKVLKESFDIGFDDVEFAKKDKAFDDLRESKKFKAIIAGGEKIVTKRRQAALKKQLEKIKAQIADFKPFDFDFKLNSSRGKEISRKDFKGKFLIVDFWGTWCTPCVREIPHFIKLKKEYGKQGLEVIGIAFEQIDDEKVAIDQVNKFSEKHKLNYESLMGDDETADAVNLDVFPTTLFMNRQGKVVFKVSGYHDYEILEGIVKELMFKKKSSGK